MKWDSYLISIFLFSTATVSFGENIQDLSQLKWAAENYVQSTLVVNTKNNDNRVEISSGQLDPRLRLTACESELIAFSPPGSRLQGNTTVGVKCTAPKPWSIYIPVKIAFYQKAIVSMVKMAKGHFINESDVTLSEVDISRIKGIIFSSKEQIIGTKTSKSIRINQVLDSAAVCLVCKGDSITITVNSSAIAVSVTGVALNSGSKGDKIRVQNNTSRRIIEAIVVDIDTVKANI